MAFLCRNIRFLKTVSSGGTGQTIKFIRFVMASSLDDADNLRIFSTTFPLSNKFKDELTAKQTANDNPFDTYVLKPEPGRGLLKNDPILVPSARDKR